MPHTQREALTGLSTVLALTFHFQPGDVGKPVVLGAGGPAGAGEGATLPELAALCDEDAVNQKRSPERG